MPTVEARVETERPSRYLVQLCEHFSDKGRHLGHRPRAHLSGDARALHDMRAVAEQAQVEWTDAEGDVSLPWGRITLRAAPGLLTLGVEAADEEDLRRLQDLVTGHIERFGRRDGLQVNWERRETSAASPEAVVTAGAPGGGDAPRRSRLRVMGLVVVVALVLAVHLRVGGVLLANWQWTGWAAGGVLLVVLVKVAALGGFALRRGRAAKSR
ncbi:DUF2218 domain-containing protein [Streptomyces sp. NL15-2K]|uniref:DUF2218 domain-containing protein n=1 Tax=Streptomyces sp. NL15-2K TaxID=376149 RepID=UPI000F56BD07|nr:MULTISPECIES: DUF2218 domain-containing protein [Actinomycetes]WKX06478.1 DUF2218 domain-containing protein [Kutzneria buriramensis]GCB43485.1 hypothetical protein SNL152K_770 [Streptomyces sp. NL15-2K]